MLSSSGNSINNGRGRMGTEIATRGDFGLQSPSRRRSEEVGLLALG